MRTSFRWLAAALLLAPLFARAQQPSQDETIYLEEVKKDFLERAKKCEETRDWKGLFDHYKFALVRYGQSVVQVAPDRWTSVREYFIGRIARLPREAFEFYRFENDGKARAAFEKARESGVRRDLERAAEEYFFATGADQVIDALAGQAFDEGRVEEARAWWNRLLRLYPDSRIPRAVTAARVANACRVSENAAALADLRKYLAQNKVEGKISMGGRAVEIATYVDGVALPDRAAALRPAKLPYVPDPEDRLRRPSLGVRNDIRRWVYDFNEDRAETAAEAVPEPQQKQVVIRGGFRGRGAFRMDSGGPPPYPEFPLVPAYSKVRGKEYVIFTDGSRVVAVDPARVKGKSTTSGVYWKYPSEKAIPRPQPGATGQFGRPYIGVTIDGEYAFATMYSSPEARPRENNQQNQDFFEGVTAVKCLHIPTGKLVWDTDLSPVLDEFKVVCKDFFERNFSFSAPPLVRGDRLYLGICTSPMGELESRVVCLDRKTGRPLWTTFLSSVPGLQNGFMNGVSFLPAYLPLLVEQGGTLYVQTNLGVVGALNPANGALQWLTRYRRAGRRMQPNTGMMEAAFKRPANVPLLWNGMLFVLAQDRAELMAFDTTTGEEAKLPPAAEMHVDLEWKSMLHLLGPVNDELVIAGASKSFELRLRDDKGACFRANYLIASACRGAGRGAVTDDYAYLPVMGEDDNNPLGGLGIYDVRTWKVVERPSWKEPNEFGNLLVAGNYLVVATNRISVYTDVETLRNQYARRLGQSPPHAESLLEYGDTMRENDRLGDAGEAYLAFIRAVEGDPAQAEVSRKVRRELHGIFIKQGYDAAKRGEEGARQVAEATKQVQDALKARDEAEKKNDPAALQAALRVLAAAESAKRSAEAVRKTDAEKALECYGFAKQFAWDHDSEAEAVKKLAGTYEGLGLWKEAVAQYQELIQKGRKLFHREREDVTKLWDHAARRIDEIVSKAPGAYADVEQKAADALKKVKEDSVDGLRDVMDRFPNSKAAREAFNKMRDTLLKQGRLDKLRALYGDFQDRFKLKLNFDAYKELLELLEKLGDLDRLKFELARFAERFPGESITKDGADEPVKDYVERRLAEIARQPRASTELKGPLRPLGELEAVKPSFDPQGVALGHQPLCPLGVEPGDLGADRELFKRGSSIELWDLKAKKRLWVRPHPGAWLGALYGDAPQGVLINIPKQGSPAEKAGLKKDDLLLSIDGVAVRSSNLGEVVSSFAPGASVELVYRRAGAELRSRTTLAAAPPEYRPAVVGASFTREGSLAVAWEDLLASIDLATGDVQWIFRVSRDRFLFHDFHATEGRLYLYEAVRSDRSSDPMRMPSPGTPVLFKPEEAHHLLFCLSDFTGEVLWARKFSFDPVNPFQEYRVEFMGRYLADHVSLLHMNSRSGAYEWALWLIPAQAGARSETGALREPQKRPLIGQKLAHAVDEEGGIFYYVADVPERRDRTLYSLNLNPARQNFKPVEIALQQKYMPQNFNYSVCSLAADREFLALVVSPPQPGNEHRIWVWKTADLKDRALTLLEGRTLPVNRPSGLGIGADGMLYVYNVPREKTAGVATGRAYVTAFRLKAPAGVDPVAWDAKAPFMNDTTTATMIHNAGSFEVLATPQATPTGESGEKPAVVVYDRQADGYVRLDRADLVRPSDTPGEFSPPALAWRGRLYVMSTKALEIFGD
ncbi:MAG: PQQ-binding-like beta-propeller repeat protein [Planctomycetes bacterium]|nr:PQQ-binding-like beta-propeller repeat protein [Planctomycetota bacterium]